MGSTIVNLVKLVNSSIISAQVADSPSATSTFFYIPQHPQKAYYLVYKQVWCYILGSPKLTNKNPSETSSHHPLPTFPFFPSVWLVKEN